MKRNSLVLMLCASIAGLAGTAGALRLATNAESSVTLDNNDYYVSSVAIRLTDEATETGVRFVSQFEKNKFDAANVSEVAFEVLPEIFKDENVAAVQISVELTDRKEITENEKTYYQFAGYIYDFPANNYGLKLVARGYAKYDGTKEFYTEYSPAYSLTDVAKTADSALQDKVDEYVVENVDITYKNIDGNNSSDSETLAYGATLNYPAVAVPQGYSFAGWYTKKDTKWNTSWTAQGNMTLTAKFEKLPYGDLITNDLFASGTEVETSAPDGFTTMKKITAVWDESKKSPSNAKTVWADIANVDVSEYLTIRLQLQISGSWVLFDGWSTYFGSGKTIDVTMTHKTKSSWEIAFVGADGTAKVTRNGNNLNELLKMELDARSVALGDADCNPSTIIFSDVRGEKGAIPVEPIPVTGTIVDEKLYSANGIGTSETEEEIPQGFEKIAMYTTNGADVHGQFFSAVNISEYSEVHFAVKTDGKFVLNQEKSDDSGEWLYFTLTQGADQTWTIAVKKADGTEIYNKGGFGGYKSDSPSPYTNYALNAILYGCPSGGFYPEKANDSAATLNVWFTEVRGIKKS